MRRICALALIICGLFGQPVFSQETGQKIPFHSNQRLSLTQTPVKSVACGVDTIAYPYFKELTLTAADSFFIDAMAGNVRSTSQAYHITDPLRIHGVQFWGGAYTVSSAPKTLLVRAYLYSVDANNQPVNKLDSADVTITDSYDFYEAMFATPYTYDQNFAVAVRSVPNDTLAVILNNAGNSWNPTDYSESLAWRRFGSGVWNTTLGFFGQDNEYMVFPIVSYDIEADFVSDEPSCTGTPSEFYSTSSAHLGNRMLNLYAFDAYWNGATDSTFTWNAGSVQVGDTAAYTFAAPGTQTVALSAEMLGYYTACSDTYSDTIQVTETPEAQTDPSVPVALCEGEMVTISALPAAGVSYQWLLDGSEEADSTQASYTAEVSGSYAVIVSNSCGIDTSEAVNVVVNPLPQIPVITASGTHLIVSPASGTFQWYLDGQEIPGETNDSINIQENGDYTVVVTNAFDCSSESAVFDVNYVGLKEHAQGLIAVFPNPSKGEVTIHSQTIGIITITAADGKQVYSSLQAAGSEWSVDLSRHGGGVYFVRYSGNEGGQVLRVVISK